jgi:hypothetical protein
MQPDSLAILVPRLLRFTGFEPVCIATLIRALIADAATLDLMVAAGVVRAVVRQLVSDHYGLENAVCNILVYVFSRKPSQVSVAIQSGLLTYLKRLRSTGHPVTVAIALHGTPHDLMCDFCDLFPQRATGTHLHTSC